MFDIFCEENYYYCMNCGKYSCELIREEEYYDHTVRYYECINCFELDSEIID